MAKENKKTRPSPPADVRNSYRFDYQLSYEEAYEAFSALSFKRSRKFRLGAGALLALAAVFMLITFALDPNKVMNLFLALIAVLLLFYLIYFPVLKARRGARSVAKARGTYKVEITKEGTISIPKMKPIPLDGDKDARAIETDTILAIRPDSSHTYCIPKRVIRPKDLEDLRKILGTYIKVE